MKHLSYKNNQKGVSPAAHRSGIRGILANIRGACRHKYLAPAGKWECFLTTLEGKEVSKSGGETSRRPCAKKQTRPQGYLQGKLLWFKECSFQNKDNTPLVFEFGLGGVYFYTSLFGLTTKILQSGL